MTPDPRSLLSVSIDLARESIPDEVLLETRARAGDALEALVRRTATGREFLGWLDLPARMRGSTMDSIVSTAKRLRSRHDALVVIGIGGSSLGTRAGLSALGRGAEEVPLPGDEKPVVFAGHHLSGDMLSETLRSLEGRDFAINVISKSGTTTEPGIAFRVLLSELRRRHPDGWKERIVATTDPEKGALREMATENGFVTFDVPPDVGGRFSVLSPVGLFPLAFAGVDVAAMLDGAETMRAATLEAGPGPQNPAVQLAVARHALFRSGFSVDVLSYTSPRLRRFAGWWQQLFGESEGKDGTGPFPAACEIPADLHSLGQYMQDGTRQVYETFLHVASQGTEIRVPEGESRDGLDYLEGRPTGEVLDAALKGTIEAHRSGGVPVIEVTLPRMDEAVLGGAFYSFEMAVALGGALLGVNPFDQPGVEGYKRNMFRLLGKPGA